MNNNKIKEKKSDTNFLNFTILFLRKNKIKIVDLSNLALLIVVCSMNYDFFGLRSLFLLF